VDDFIDRVIAFELWDELSPTRLMRDFNQGGTGALGVSTLTFAQRAPLSWPLLIRVYPGIARDKRVKRDRRELDQ